MIGKYFISIVTVIGILIIVLPVSMLHGKTQPNFKATANLGLVNGGTLGILADHDKLGKRSSYVYLTYMTCDFTTYGGVSYTELRPWNDRFYYAWSGGFDIGKIANLSWDPGGGDEDSPKYKQMIIPHITFGVGYNLARWETGTAFIEWDIGIKASITNINLGVTF